MTRTLWFVIGFTTAASISMAMLKRDVNLALNSKVEACTEIFSVLNQKHPETPFVCSVYKGQPAISNIAVPGLYVSLDGNVLAQPTD